MDVHQEADQLRQVPMFAKLDPARLKLLAFTSEVVNFHRGEVLFRAGDRSDCAYVIMDGLVDVLAGDTDDEGEAGVVVTRGRNELIGEMGILNCNAARSATLRARDEVHTLRIGSDLFLRLVAECPQVALDVMRQLSEKLVSSLEHTEALLRRVRELEQARS